MSSLGILLELGDFILGKEDIETEALKAINFPPFSLHSKNPAFIAWKILFESLHELVV